MASVVPDDPKKTLASRIRVIEFIRKKVEKTQKEGMNASQYDGLKQVSQIK